MLASDYLAHFELTPTELSTYVECNSIADAPINTARYKLQCAIVDEGTCMSDNFPAAKALGTSIFARCLVTGSCSFHRH